MVSGLGVTGHCAAPLLDQESVGDDDGVIGGQTENGGAEETVDRQQATGGVPGTQARHGRALSSNDVEVADGGH